jgi:aminoglycoside phosphotransferase (APT) family kinase protein
MSDENQITASGDTGPVRATEQLDWTALASYLRAQLSTPAIPGLDLSAPMQVAQFNGGHSNLTYLLRFGEGELVLRRPPFGPVPPSAHDMAREYRWLTAMHPIFPPAPRPYVLCENPDVAGATFYVMERRHGVVIRDEEPAELAHPDARRRVSEAMVDTLADLHAIDVERAGLTGLGKPSGFVGRQVRGWTDRWQRSRIGELPDMEAVTEWLLVRLPPEPPQPAVVHGDFKLNNVMLEPRSLDRIVAVFDWEMSALGDPLVDVGIFLAYWSSPSVTAQQGDPDVLTGRRGWLTREQLVERYARRSGRDLSRIRFYEVFALFKIAVVIQQIFYRYAHGQTDDPRFAHLDARVSAFARRAADLIRTNPTRT